MSSILLTDELWERLEPLLPRPRRTNRHVQYAGRKPSDARRIVNGILFVLRTGVPWRLLPATSDFPSGYTCRRRLRRWHKAGVWQQLFETLLAELPRTHQLGTHQLDWHRALVDSSTLRAPSGGAKTGPNPTDRRKLGSKHHLLVEARGIPLAVILTKANRHDVTQLLPLLDKVPRVKGERGVPRSRPKQVQGDRAYVSEPHRQAIKIRGYSRCSPSGEPLMGAAWERPAGSWNEVSHGFISFESSRFGRRGCPRPMKPYCYWLVPSFVSGF